METFQALATSLGLGLLVGLQRERAGAQIAGFRTFALITILGALCALLSEVLGPWPVAAGYLAVAAMVVVGNLIAAQSKPDHQAGITTEIAVLVMFGVGALCVIGSLTVAVAIGVAVALLLESRQRLHGIAARVSAKDMRAIMLFAAITFIVLPVLPDRAFGPLGVLNPRNIWLMVVLVVGISLGGYVAYKLFGARGGTVLSGLLGGLISSTATTVTYSRRAASESKHARAAALVIILASTTVYARLMFEVAVVAPGFFAQAALPLGIMMAVAIALAAVLWFRAGPRSEEMPEPQNPTQLRPALIFAALYALVLLGVAAAREYAGQGGIYAVAAISGLTDNDAITLSTSRLVERGGLAAEVGWRAIVIAVIANILFKTGVVAALGGRQVLIAVSAIMGAQVVAGLLLIWLL